MCMFSRRSPSSEGQVRREVRSGRGYELGRTRKIGEGIGKRSWGPVRGRGRGVEIGRNKIEFPSVISGSVLVRLAVWVSFVILTVFARQTRLCRSVHFS